VANLRHLFLSIVTFCACAHVFAADPATYRVSTFEADITIPIGHACMGGGRSNARVVVDPLYAKGMVLFVGDEKPIVLVALDWCQCNDDSYDPLA